MDSFPPSPHSGFLQVPIPSLGGLESSHPAWKLEAARAEELWIQQPDHESAGWIWQMAAIHRDRGRFEMALSYANTAAEKAQTNGIDSDYIQALAVRASVQVLQGNFNSARETLNRIRPLLIGVSDRKLVAVYEETLATLLLRMVGSTLFEFEEAGDRYTKAWALYEELGDIPGQLRCTVGMASVLSGRGQYFKALERIDQGLKLSKAHDLWSYTGQLLGCAAFAFRDQGYRQKVSDLFDLSLDWTTFVGDIPGRIRFLGGLAELGRMEYEPPAPDALDKTVAMMAQAIWEAKEIGAGPMMLEIQIALVNLYKKAGDRESAWKARVLADKIAQTEAFEGAHRVIDWSTFITDRLTVAREERIASRLEEAIEGSADPFLVFDPRQGSDASKFDLLNEFRNTAAANLLGISESGVWVLADLEQKPEFKGLSEPLMHAAVERQSFEDEVSLVDKSGAKVWYARRVAPAGTGAVLTFRDVTNRHQIEEALREAAQRAHEADRAKSEFLANMSHEVRTPINGVLGLAQLLADLPLEPVARKYVEGIVSSGNILLQVIGDVLDLSKIEARKMELSVGPTLLRPLVTDVIRLFEGQTFASGIALNVNFRNGVPDVVMLAAPSLRQVLANLVGNAIKFTPVGHIDVNVAVVNHALYFEVCDTGVGVRADRIDAIFDPFEQSDLTQQVGGTGLGLTISKRLIELMGGNMGVTSSQGTGSCFFFTLPLVEADAIRTHSTPATMQEDIRFDGKRVLLVEDNPVNTLVSEGMLNRLGCEVTCVENGLEAVERFEEDRFDLVLMDMRMPVMDGISATRRIRESESTLGGHTPIVALTAGALTQEREACLAAGMDDYLGKPFTLRALRETIYRAIGELSERTLE